MQGIRTPQVEIAFPPPRKVSKLRAWWEHMTREERPAIRFVAYHEPFFPKGYDPRGFCPDVKN